MRTRPARQLPRSRPPGAGEETLGADAAPSWVIKSDDINTSGPLLKAYCVESWLQGAPVEAERQEEATVTV